VRIGTTGGLQRDIPINSFILSRYAGGLDTVLNYYRGMERVCDLEMEKAFSDHTGWPQALAQPYFVPSSHRLFDLLDGDVISGITLSAPGFYGPQGRNTRLIPQYPHLNERYESFNHAGFRITNYEMESSALFGLSALLEHDAVSICAMIANRFTGEFTGDYKPLINNLVKFTLDRLTRVRE
jgi:uridine phosphorylase